MFAERLCTRLRKCNTRPTLHFTKTPVCATKILQYTKTNNFPYSQACAVCASRRAAAAAAAGVVCVRQPEQARFSSAPRCAVDQSESVRALPKLGSSNPVGRLSVRFRPLVIQAPCNTSVHVCSSRLRVDSRFWMVLLFIYFYRCWLGSLDCTALNYFQALMP